MWRNDTKCKYMFMFPLKNFARKGLLKSSVENKSSFQVIAWCWTGCKPLPKPMVTKISCHHMISLGDIDNLTHLQYSYGYQGQYMYFVFIYNPDGFFLSPFQAALVKVVPNLARQRVRLPHTMPPLGAARRSNTSWTLTLGPERGTFWENVSTHRCLWSSKGE